MCQSIHRLNSSPKECSTLQELISQLHNDLFQFTPRFICWKYTRTNQFRILADSLQLVCFSFLACFEDLLIWVHLHFLHTTRAGVGKRGLTVHEPCKFNVQQKRCIQSKSQDGISRSFWSEMMCWMLIWLASSNIEEAIETKKCCGVSWYSIIPLYAYRKKILGLNSFF